MRVISKLIFSISAVGAATRKFLHGVANPRDLSDPHFRPKCLRTDLFPAAYTAGSLPKEPAHPQRARHEHAGPQPVVLPPRAADVLFAVPLPLETRPGELLALGIALMLRREADNEQQGV